MSPNNSDFTNANDDGNTALQADDLAALIPTWVTCRAELNAVEEANILRGILWAEKQARMPGRDILSESFIRNLHKSMFGEVWSWAGRFRTIGTNIGVEPYSIATDLQNLIADTRAWIEFKSYVADEMLARFHHRLVSIHPFPNGNGRHARVMTDLLAVRLGVAAFTWGGQSFTPTGPLRRRYIESLQQADRGSILPLIEFCRS